MAERWARLKQRSQVSGIPLTILKPRVWKQFHRFRGDNKELSRQHALQLFPTAHALFTHKKDLGRTEAALVALTAPLSVSRLCGKRGGPTPTNQVRQGVNEIVKSKSLLDGSKGLKPPSKVSTSSTTR
jgi:hypothetical protein